MQENKSFLSNGMRKVDSTLNYLTVWILVAMLVLASVVDVYQSIYKGPQATISATVWELSRRYPALPFLIGFLCGHLLWPQGK